MIHYIYCRPLYVIIIWMIFTILIVSLFYVFIPLEWSKRFRRFNLILLVLSIVAVVYTTLFRHLKNVRLIEWNPLTKFKAALVQKEYYREMLMNIFLFFPLGISISGAWKRRVKSWQCVLISALIGFLLSACIEALQYVFACGSSEINDILCNTLGALLGGLPVLLSVPIRIFILRIQQAIFYYQNK